MSTSTTFPFAAWKSFRSAKLKVNVWLDALPDAGLVENGGVPTVKTAADCHPEFPEISLADVYNTFEPPPVVKSANALVKVTDSIQVNELPLPDTEVPDPLIVHWLFCKLLVVGKGIGEPLA
jgi:hypothetical protein